MDNCLFRLGNDPVKMIKDVKRAIDDGEGCRVFGVLDVQRVAGNFHISVHGLNIMVAQQIFEGANHVNVSHVIHDLSFGLKYPGIHNPLDDTVRILRDASGTFKYYIKIVPTDYRYLSKGVLPTNQFSVTEYFVAMKDSDRSWPAVYFFCMIFLLSLLPSGRKSVVSLTLLRIFVLFLGALLL